MVRTSHVSNNLFLISFFTNGMTDKEQKINDLKYSLKIINPYPANVDKMVGSYQCWPMADGI